MYVPPHSQCELKANGNGAKMLILTGLLTLFNHKVCFQINICSSDSSTKHLHNLKKTCKAVHVWTRRVSEPLCRFDNLALQNNGSGRADTKVDKMMALESPERCFEY